MNKKIGKITEDRSEAKVPEQIDKDRAETAKMPEDALNEVAGGHTIKAVHEKSKGWPLG